MTKVRFYNVRKRASVAIDEKQCYKAIYQHETANGIQKRYAVRSKDDDGTNLTKFINKETYDKLNCRLGKK